VHSEDQSISEEITLKLTNLISDILLNGTIYDPILRSYIRTDIIIGCKFNLGEKSFKGLFCLPDMFVEQSSNQVKIDGRLFPIGHYDFTTDEASIISEEDPKTFLRSIVRIDEYIIDVKGKGKNLEKTIENLQSTVLGFEFLNAIYVSKEDRKLFNENTYYKLPVKTLNRNTE
jgi:hypothetical protein